MILDFILNPVVFSALVAYLVCQIIKFIIMSKEQRGTAWEAFYETGGMPSSHASFVSTVTTSIFFLDGYTSNTFLIALAFSIIVVRDAMGVRRTVDNLIKYVNSIIRKKKIGLKDITGIAGHSPVQVAVGILIGIGVAILVNYFPLM